jgi:tripartite motif-containing protein 71
MQVFEKIQNIKELPVDLLIQSTLNFTREKHNSSRVALMATTMSKTTTTTTKTTTAAAAADSVNATAPAFCSCCVSEYEEKVVAVKYCKACNLTLCNDHVNLHQKSMKTRSHILESVDKIPMHQIVENTKKLFPTCEKHSNERLKFVCECGQLTCRDCALNEHKIHNHKNIEEAALEEKPKLKNLVMETYNSTKLIENYLVELTEMIKKIEKKCTSECSKVEEAGKQLKSQIDKRITALVNDIKAKKNFKTKNLQLQKDYWQDMISRAKMNDIELIDHVDDFLLLQLKTLMEQKHKEFQKMLKVPEEIVHNDSFEVRLENKELGSIIEKWGELIDEDIFSIDDCCVSGIGKIAFLNKEAQFSIQLKTRDGKNLQYGIQPKVEIRDAKQKFVDYEMGFSELEASFKVNYTPINEGLLTINVTIDGQHLKNSPFSAHVLSPSQEPKFKFKSKFGSYGNNNGQFDCPFFITTDKKGDIYVSDYKNHRIQIFTSNGVYKRSLGSEGSENGQFMCPMGLTFNSKGHLIVADQQNHRVQVFDENMQFIKSFGSVGRTNGLLREPYGVAVDAEDNIVVADSNNHRVQIFTSDGIWKSTIGKRGSDEGEFDSPWSVAVSKIYHRIFVSDSGNNRIQVFDSEGKYLDTYPPVTGPEDSHLEQPRGLALTNCHQFLLVCDWGYHRILVLNALNGQLIKSYDSKGTKEEQLEYPEGICVSPSGQMLITEWKSNRALSKATHLMGSRSTHKVTLELLSFPCR